jgi:L-asparaginase
MKDRATPAEFSIQPWKRYMTLSLPRVAVIGTGGTISSWARSSLDGIDDPNFGRKLSVVEILDRFEETRLVANPLPISFRSVGSTADLFARC